MFASLLALIPGALSLLQWWFGKQVDIEMAKTNASRDVAVAAVQAAAQEADGRAKTWGFISGSKLLSLLVIFLAVPIGLYEWKEIVVDKIIGPGCILEWCWIGNTDPIGDTMVAGWMNTIIASLFASSSVLAVAHLWWTTKD